MKPLVSLFTLFAVVICFSANAQFGESTKQIYKSNNYKEVLETHKIVAILPFKSTISYKKNPKNYSAEINLAEEKRMGINLQQGMFTYLLRKQKDYFVDFQDIDRTNALLKQANVYDNIDNILPDSLCKILKVDAVIKCLYQYEKSGSEAGAIASAILLGSGKTGSGSLTMQINDKKQGDLIWRFYKEMNETITSNANEVMERMMKKVARNFPYEK